MGVVLRRRVSLCGGAFSCPPSLLFEILLPAKLFSGKAVRGLAGKQVRPNFLGLTFLFFALKYHFDSYIYIKF